MISFRTALIMFAMSTLFALPVLTGCAPVLIGGAGAVGYAGAQTRSVGEAVDDSIIAGKITSRFVQADVNDLLQNVNTKVTEGRVLLTGMVNKPETRVEAVKLVWQIDGVKEVINEIQVEGNNGVPQYMKDAWITTQVKSKLLVEKDIRSINYNVETVGNIVYLIGIAQNQAELDKATYIASTIKGVKKVISHVRMANDPARD